MQRIVVDPSHWTVFSLGDAAELCDDAGHVLGYFTPAVDRSVYEGVESPTSIDELLRRKQEGGGRPLVDILRDLESRA
jgi:hypothetical protein